MVRAVDPSDPAQVPMRGGTFTVAFESAEDLQTQENQFLSGNHLFLAGADTLKPFSEFELILILPDQSRTQPVHARAVQIITMGSVTGALLELLNFSGKLESHLETQDTAKPNPAPQTDPLGPPPAPSPSIANLDQEPEQGPLDQDPESETVDDGEDEDSGKDRLSTYDRIRQLNVNERARLAKRATKLERSLLIRDHEPQVLFFLLKNPRLTRQEMLEISKSTALTYQSVQLILANKGWSGSEELRHNLVINPKTPVPTALKLLPSLNMRHLRELAKNHGIKEQIKRAALRIVLERAP